MMFIDPSTGWFEIVQVSDDDKTSAQISLCQYPRPKRVHVDNSSGFKKYFQQLLTDFAVELKLTSIKHPQ